MWIIIGRGCEKPGFCCNFQGSRLGQERDPKITGLGNGVRLCMGEPVYGANRGLRFAGRRNEKRHFTRGQSKSEPHLTLRVRRYSQRVGEGSGDPTDAGEDVRTGSVVKIRFLMVYACAAIGRNGRLADNNEASSCQGQAGPQCFLSRPYPRIRTKILGSIKTKSAPVRGQEGAGCIFLLKHRI